MHLFYKDKLENFNYLNVAFISYKLTMWNWGTLSGTQTGNYEKVPEILPVLAVISLASIGFSIQFHMASYCSTIKTGISDIDF